MRPHPRVPTPTPIIIHDVLHELRTDVHISSSLVAWAALRLRGPFPPRRCGCVAHIIFAFAHSKKIAISSVVGRREERRYHRGSLGLWLGALRRVVVSHVPTLDYAILNAQGCVSMHRSPETITLSRSSPQTRQTCQRTIWTSSWASWPSGRQTHCPRL